MSPWIVTALCSFFLSMLLLNAVSRGIAVFTALADDDE